LFLTANGHDWGPHRRSRHPARCEPLRGPRIAACPRYRNRLAPGRADL